MDVGEKTFPSKSNHTAAISGSICSLRIFLPATLWHLRAVTSRHETEHRRAPDYRSINEVQLKYELIKLEKKILDITGDPIDYKNYSSFLDWCRDDAKVEAEKNKPLLADVTCDWWRLKDKTPSASDEELECANIMDDEDSWAEGPLRHPKLDHIKVCYALHALCTHMN